MSLASRTVPGVALACLLTAAPCAAQSRFDLLVRGGLVVDGSGSEGFRADVGIRDGWIVRVGDLSGAAAARTIDASASWSPPGSSTSSLFRRAPGRSRP